MTGPISSPPRSSRGFFAAPPILALCVAIHTAAAAADEPKPPAKPATDALGDPLPFGALLRLGTTRLRNQGGYATVFSADGKTLYSAGHGGIWAVDRATGEHVLWFEDRHGSWLSLALSPDGKTLAGAGNYGPDKSLVLWDIPTRTLQIAWDGHPDGAKSVCFSPDGKLLASGGNGGYDNTVRVWDVATKTELHRWEGGRGVGRIESVIFSPDGKYLAAANDSGSNAGDSVRLWDLKDSKMVWQTGGPPRAASLQFTPDSKQLYAGGYQGVVWVLDAADGKRRDGPKLSGREIVLTDRGKTLLAVSPEEGATRVQVCDATTGKIVRKFVGHGSSIISLALTSDEKTLATASRDGNIIFWDLRTGKRHHSFPGHEYEVWAAAYSPDGQTLATFAGDFTVRLWDTRTGKQRHCLDVGPKRDFVGSGLDFQCWAHALAFSPTGRLLAAPGPRGTVYLWDPTTGQERARLEGHPRMPRCLAFSREGKTLASADEQGRLVLWDMDDKREIGRLEVKGKPASGPPAIWSLGFSPDGKTLAAGYTDEALRLWDVEKKTLQTTHRCWAINGLVFSEGGRLLAAGDLGVGGGVPALIRFLLPDSGEEYRRLTLAVPEDKTKDTPLGHFVFALSPDERTLVVVGVTDTSLHWYERATNREIAHFPGLAKGTQCVAFSPDGRSVATGGRDKTVLVWDLFRAVGGATAAPETVTEKRAAELWIALGDPDPARAYPAMGLLVSAPERAVALCQEHLRPAPGTQRTSVAQLIAALDDDSFAIRQAAARDLVMRGAESLLPVQQALQKPVSPEAASGLRQVLTALRNATPKPEVLRPLRAVQVLEVIGSQEAAQVLTALAAGAPDAPLTRAAKAARERVQKR